MVRRQGPNRRAVRAVLFDFAGTLFDDTTVLTGSRLLARCAARGVRLEPDRARELCSRIRVRIESPEGRAVRHGCDRDRRLHQKVWTELAGSVPGITPAIADAFYDCVTDVTVWRPYPDSAATLASLHDQGVRVGVVSNTGWDIRRSFREAGMAGSVDTFVLSCDVGLVKPEPGIFRLACSRLGVEPADTLMVGDDPATDGGAVTVGIPVYLLPAARGCDRPRGHSAVLALSHHGSTTGVQREDGG